MKQKKKSRRRLLVGASCLLSPPLMAGDVLDVVLDGYAYEVSSDIRFDLAQQTIIIDQSNMTNCQRPGGFMPLNDVSITLQTNGQLIGITHNRYYANENLYLLSSQTSNVICDNGVFVDQIFINNFEAVPSPFVNIMDDPEH